MNCLAEVQNGTIVRVEVRTGIPRKLTIERQMVEALLLCNSSLLDARCQVAGLLPIPKSRACRGRYAAARHQVALASGIHEYSATLSVTPHPESGGRLPNIVM
jgi:hypothetical protein